MAPEVYIEKLSLSPHRPRGYMPRVSARLLELMRNHGPVEPVVARSIDDNRYEILSNAEVWLAAQRLQIERVPVHIVEHLSDEEAADIVRAASQGLAANPLDEAEYLASELERIEPSGNRHRAIGKLALLTGYRRPYISHALRLLTLPTEIQNRVRQDVLTAGAARALVGIPNRTAQLSLARRTVRESLSVRAVEIEARRLKKGEVSAANSTDKRRKAAPKDANTVRLERALSDQLGCEVHVKSDAGELVLRYHSLEILDGVLQRLGIDEF